MVGLIPCIWLISSRFCDSPTEELDSRTPKGRGKRGRSAGLTPDLSNFTETRSSVSELFQGYLIGIFQLTISLSLSLFRCSRRFISLMRRCTQSSATAPQRDEVRREAHRAMPAAARAMEVPGVVPRPALHPQRFCHRGQRSASLRTRRHRHSTARAVMPMALERVLAA